MLPTGLVVIVVVAASAAGWALLGVFWHHRGFTRVLTHSRTKHSELGSWRQLWPTTLCASTLPCTWVVGIRLNLLCKTLATGRWDLMTSPFSSVPPPTPHSFTSLSNRLMGGLMNCSSLFFVPQTYEEVVWSLRCKGQHSPSAFLKLEKPFKGKVKHL